MLRTIVRPEGDSARDRPASAGGAASLVALLTGPAPLHPAAYAARAALALASAVAVSTLVDGALPSFYSNLYPLIVVYAALTLPLPAALAVTAVAATGVRPFAVDLLDETADSPAVLLRPIALGTLCVLASALRDRAYAAVDAGTRLYRALAHNFPNGALFMFDRDLRLTVADGAGLAPAGLSSEQIEGRLLSEVFDEGTAAQLEPLARAALAGEEAARDIARGADVYAVCAVPLRDEAGNVTGGIVMSQDASEARRGRQAETLLAAVAACSDDAIFATNVGGTVLSWNLGAEELFGYSAEEISGQPVVRLVPEEYRQESDRLFRRVLGGETVSHHETVRQRIDGSRLEVSLSMAPLRDPEGRINGACVVARDVSAGRRAEDAVQHMAYHDALTGLANRRLAGDRLAQAIAHARRYGSPLALLSLDIDAFAVINDRHGPEAGDAVLRVTAERIRAAVRDTDTAARVGGDEFLVILTESTRVDAETVISRVQGAMAEPVAFAGLKLRPGLSIGLAVFDEHAESAQALLNAANRAMWSEKARRKAAGAEEPVARSK
jgi:diguanylate cyclase (GGDEF)-like protein/PAS domain S-box-containing protein